MLAQLEDWVRDMLTVVATAAADGLTLADRMDAGLASGREIVGKADGTVPTLPTRWLNGPDERLDLGGMVFEFTHRGGAHTPGDTLVWLPQKVVLFTG